jgi:hypothetical protein
MKTNTLRSKLLAAAALALGTGFTISNAIAGPGPDYWRNQGKAPSPAPSAPAAPTPQTVAACTDARLVSVKETKFIQANGRGPMRTVEVGKKLVCTSCATPMIVMKPSGFISKGALTPVTIRGKHDCTKAGCTPAATVAQTPAIQVPTALDTPKAEANAGPHH